MRSHVRNRLTTFSSSVCVFLIQISLLPCSVTAVCGVFGLSRPGNRILLHDCVFACEQRMIRLCVWQVARTADILDLLLFNIFSTASLSPQCFESTAQVLTNLTK